MNHPRSTDPGEALRPTVPGTAGSRLFELFRTELPGAGLADYERAFERRNLLLSTSWSSSRARREAARLRGELRAGGERVVVALGREVRDLLRVPLEWPWILPWAAEGYVVRAIPHPSGLNRWYNGPEERQVVAMMLAELASAELSAQGRGRWARTER